MSWVKRVLGLLRMPVGGAGRATQPAITCHEALAFVYEYLDGELDPDMEARVGAHLEVCARCYPQLRLERTYLGAVARGGWVDVVAPEGLKDDILRLLEAESV